MKKRLLLIVPIILLCMMFLIRDTDAGYPTLNLTSDAKTISVGQKTQLKVGGVKSNKVKWTTSNKNVATVSKKGVVTGVSEGKATIKGKYRGVEFKIKFIVLDNEKTYNMLLCKDKNIEVYLTKIKKGKIYVKVKNKTNKEIHFINNYWQIDGKTYYDGTWYYTIYKGIDREFPLEIYDDDDNSYYFYSGNLSGQFEYSSEDGDIPYKKLDFKTTIK